MDQLMDAMLDAAPTPVQAPYIEQDMIVAAGFRLTGTGLVPQPGATEQDWQMLGHTLTRLEGALQWLIGDWVAYGSAVWDYSVRDIALHINRDVKTIQNWVSVVRAVPLDQRRAELTFGHHELVASLPPDAQARLLQDAVDNGWSVAAMRAAMRPKKAGGTTTDVHRRFTRSLPTLEKRLAPLFARATSHERRDMAQELRRLADKLEKGT
jgi:hypothetical protein